MDLMVRMQEIIRRIERLWSRIDRLEAKLNAAAQTQFAQRST